MREEEGREELHDELVVLLAALELCGHVQSAISFSLGASTYNRLGLFSKRRPSLFVLLWP